MTIWRRFVDYIKVWWSAFDWAALTELITWLILGCVALYLLKKLIRYFVNRGREYGFQRIVGMEEIKKRLYDDVIFPFYHAKQYKKFNLSLPSGILFYGPPGCGKTFFVERLAEELNMNYMKVDHADLASPYIHETVSKISKMFEAAEGAAPCLLFIDELDSIVQSRDDMGGDSIYKHEEVNEFLLHLENASKNGVLVVGTTNHLEKIDRAIMRSGRFDLKIYIGPPDELARESLFVSELKHIPCAKDIDVLALARLTEDYTSADIVSIVKVAAREAVANGLRFVDQTLLEDAIRNTPSSLEKDE